MGKQLILSLLTDDDKKIMKFSSWKLIFIRIGRTIDTPFPGRFSFSFGYARCTVAKSFLLTNGVHIKAL